MLLDKLQFKLPEKWFKDEASFSSWFGSKLRENWGFWHKMSDMDRWTKPFDAIFALEWIVGWIEFKIVDSISSKPYKKLRWSCPENPWWQVKGMSTLLKNWGKSLVILYNRKVNEYIIIEFQNLFLDTIIHFPCTHV